MTLVIQRKALSQFNALKDKSTQDEDFENIDFNAIGVWFENFKKDHTFITLRLWENLPLRIQRLPQKLKELVFNVAETALYWKRTTGRILVFISKEESFASWG